MITRLAHLCFRTDNVRKMVDFYSTVLELKTKFTFKSPSGKEFGWYFDLGGLSFLEIFDNKGAAETWGGEAKPLAASKGVTYQHFCLEVKGIEALRERLTAKGLEVTPVKVGLDHSKQIWIKDPDGNPIEMMEYTAESLQVQS